MRVTVRATTAVFGLALASYPLVLHATPLVAVGTVIAAALALAALARPRRLSGGPAVIVAAVAYAAAASARGPVDLLAALPAAAAYLFIQGIALCGLVAGGAEMERDVLVARARSAFLVAVGGAVAASLVVAVAAAGDEAGSLGFLVAVGAACGLLLMLVGGSRRARTGPKAQDVP